MIGRGQPVTYDINVLVGAVVEGNSTFSAWPTPPPVGPNPAADCVGIANDGVEFALWLSSHVLRNVARVLAGSGGFGWSADRAEEYTSILDAIARASGGGVIEPAIRVNDCVDFEDNRILELALASQSMLIVSNDAHLLALSLWRGTPIIRPAEFVRRVDVLRRAARRR